MSTFSRPGRSGLVLSEFLNRFPVVQEEADGWVVPCPAHSDGHPSLRVALNDTSDLLLHCRAGCAKGDVLDALGLAYADLSHITPGHISKRTSSPQPLTDTHRAPLALYLDAAARALQESDDGHSALSYASRRFGMSADLATLLGLGFDDGTVPHPGLGLSLTAYRADPRLVVPFNDFSGHPAGLQARALSSTARVRWSGPTNPDDGATWNKYGVFKAGTGYPDGEVIVTEGPGDALTAVASGYDAVCIRGASLGSNTELADELTSGLEGRRVVVVGDTDGAGVKFTEKVCESLSSRGVETFRLALPAGVTDVTEWREGDPATFSDRFSQAVQEAQPYGEDEVLVDRLTAEASQLLTDVFNARALRDYILSRGADVRFTSAVGFLLYRGHEMGVWTVDRDQVLLRAYAQDATDFIQRRILDKVHSIDVRALNITSRDTRDQMASVLERLRRKVTSGRLISWAMSTAGLNNMMNELKGLPGIAMDYVEFDAHPELLAARNGVINLEDGTLSPFSDETRGLYLTRRANVDYVPGAVNPRWERFISEVFSPHPDLVPYMQRLLGYGITGHTEEQIIAVMLGGGANGKSVLMETVQHIMREHTVVTAFSTFERRESSSGGASPDIARMAGARIVVASEGDAGRPMAESMLKRLSGTEAVSARFLYRDDFTFVPTCLITLVSNHPPEIRGQDNGIWRRLKLIPFTRTFDKDEQDRFLLAKFTGRRVPVSQWRDDDDMGDGLPGILAWLVRGAVEWYATGLQEPQAIERASSNYRESSDQLGDFITDKLIPDPEASIKGSDLYSAYLDYAEEENLQGKEVWKRKTVYQAMEERQAVSYLRNGTKWMRGYRLRTKDDVLKDQGPSIFAEMKPGPVDTEAPWE